MGITNTFERVYENCTMAVNVINDKIVSARTFFGKRPMAYFDCATPTEPDGVAFTPKNYRSVWAMLQKSIDEELADDPITEADVALA